MLPVVIGGKTLQVEIASTERALRQGLSGRDSLDPDSGMLFILPKSGGTSFWMRDTRIPLSIAFISRDGSIISVHEMQPHDETHIPAPAGCVFAIEANAGWFDHINKKEAK